MTKKKPVELHNRRGNTTYGDARKGNRTGRPSSYKPGIPLYSVMVRLSEEHCAIAVTLGEGNYTEGVRRALSKCKPEGCSESRIEAELITRARNKPRHIAMRHDIDPNWDKPDTIDSDGNWDDT